MIMSQPLVSVIIPIYKVEEFLPDCLESVIHQTYSDLEIICVNDGSPDRCEDILKDYAMLDRRIKVIIKVNGERKFYARPGRIKDKICVKVTDRYDYYVDALKRYF